MKHSKLFLIILFFILPALACSLPGSEDPTATPAPTAPPPTETPVPPTATPDVTANFVTLINEESGVTVRHPADWFVEDGFFLGITSSEGFLDSEEVPEEGGGVLIVAGLAADFEGATPSDKLSSAIEEFDLGDNEEVVSGPTAVQIQGQEAAEATINGSSDDGGTFVALAVMVVNGDRAVLAFGVVPSGGEAQYRPIVEAILDTIEVGQPVVVETPTEEPVVDPPPPPPGDLIPIAPGEARADVVPEGGQIDYAFNGAAGLPVTILVDPEDGFDPVLEIYPAGDLTSALRELDDGASGTPEELVFTPPTDGPYVIRVRGFAGGGGSFDIIVTPGGEVSTGGEGTPLALGQLYEAALDGDDVNYLLTVGAGETTVVALASLTDDLDLTLTVLDAGGNQLIYEDSGFSGEPETVLFTADAAGDYIVQVGAFGLGEGSYALFAFSADEATIVEDNLPDSDAKNFRACVPAGEALIVVVQPEEGFDVILNLNGPGGGNLIDQVDEGFSGEPEIIFFLGGRDFGEDYPVILAVSGFVSGGDFTLWLISSGGPVTIDGC